MEEALRPACTGADRVAAPRDLVSVTTTRAPAFRLSRSERTRARGRSAASGSRIDRPQTRLSLRRGSEFRVSGVPSASGPSPISARSRASFGLAASYHLHLDEVIPPHAGLGSGTQLALAIGSAVAALEGLPLDLDEIAARLDRGKRSGIGIGTFGQGGAVLDGGPGPGTLPPVLARVPFPRAWRVLLIFDPAETGVHGAERGRGLCHAAGFPGKRDRGPDQARSARRVAGACRGGLQGVLRSGRLFAEKDGRLFRADAGRRLCQRRRRRCAQRPRGLRRYRARAKFMGSDRLCLRAVGGGGPKRCSLWCMAWPAAPSFVSSSRKAATKPAIIEAR